MHLVQLLLPLFDNDGVRLPEDAFTRVRTELADRFGGLTAYTRAPASGLWQDGDTGRTSRDDIVVYEVMVDGLDRDWWRSYRKQLERTFRQKELIIRAHETELL
jgi:crotonobetainyl-CoA:carnitine CoA-transferase CaiB-like acyl-CoA transferase